VIQGALVHPLLVEPKKLPEVNVNYMKFNQPGRDFIAPVLIPIQKTETKTFLSFFNNNVCFFFYQSTGFNGYH
jgi:hypothetical protein